MYYSEPLSIVDTTIGNHITVPIIEVSLIHWGTSLYSITTLLGHNTVSLYYREVSTTVRGPPTV